MLNYIDYSRLLLSILMALLVWMGLQEIVPGHEWDQEDWPAPERPASVTSRGGARPISDGLPSRDVLTVRPLVPSPSPIPVPSPHPSPQPPAEVRSSEPLPLGLFRVTAYSDSVQNGTNGHGITKSGERTRPGVVAVDPRVIPLGSKLLIEGMGPREFVALDTGGGVLGRWVDVWFATDHEAIQHGVQEREVYLLP